MDSAEVDRLLDIPISAEAFATMERSLPADVLENPYAHFEKVRDAEGDIIAVDKGCVGGVDFPFLHLRHRPVYVAVGFNTVREIAANSEVFYQDYERGMDVLMGPNQLAGMNPPLHKKYRALVMRAFELHSLPQLSESFIEPVVAAMIDRIVAKGSSELMQDLASRLPVLLIGQICALPQNRYGEFASHAGAIMASSYDWDTAIAASESLRQTFIEIIDQKRQNPGNDLISKLIAAEIDGERLAQEDIISTCRALIPAGIETTVRALGNLCVAILNHPDQFEQVKQDPKLAGVFIEELLRWNGPAQMVPKRAREDVTIAGTTIPKDARVWCYIGHANRDPRHWDEPDSFNINRKRQAHLAFSFGTHFCVGNQFAKREMDVVMKAFISRIPDIAFDPAHGEPKIGGVIFRSPDVVHALANR